MEPRFFTSFDGARIAYYLFGEKNRKTMILANGLGGNIVAWRHFIRHFEKDYRIISWDYRGLYNSDGGSAICDFSFDAHCADLKKLLAITKVRKATFVGWSMGVQLNFDFYRKYPAYFNSLVQINGAYGNIFDSAFNASLTKVSPLLIYFVEYVFPRIAVLNPILTRTRAVIALSKFTGLVSSTLDEEVFFELVNEFIYLNFSNYAKTLNELGRHNAEDMLGSIKVPTLIVAGDRDLMTPTFLSEDMSKKIPDSELFVITGGTHYTPVEFPDVVNLRIEKFLRERQREKPRKK